MLDNCNRAITLQAEPFLTVHMLCTDSSPLKREIKEALLVGCRVTFNTKMLMVQIR